jgi:hypothetical protein
MDDLDTIGRRQAHSALKGRGLVALGDVDGVERAFGVDAGGAVLFACSVAPGHHGPAIA